MSCFFVIFRRRSPNLTRVFISSQSLSIRQVSSLFYLTAVPSRLISNLRTQCVWWKSLDILWYSSSRFHVIRLCRLFLRPKQCNITDCRCYICFFYISNSSIPMHCLPVPNLGLNFSLVFLSISSVLPHNQLKRSWFSVWIKRVHLSFAVRFVLQLFC